MRVLVEVLVCYTVCIICWKLLSVLGALLPAVSCSKQLLCEGEWSPPTLGPCPLQHPPPTTEGHQ